MFPLGLAILFAGFWLVDSGYKNRAPLATLKAVISNPSQLRSTLAGSSAPTPGAVPHAAPGDGTFTGRQTGSAAGAAAITFATAQLGKPYVWGGTGPDSFDCSGLVQAAFSAAGVSLPRTTYQQIFSGVAVDRAHLLPGDLIFPDPGHVAIYLGNNQMIDAPHTGAFVRTGPAWGFWKGRRV